MIGDVPNITPVNRNTRNPHYCARYRYRGKQHLEATGARTLKEFEKAKADLEQLFRDGKWTPPEQRKRAKNEAEDLFATFAQEVLKKRINMGVKSAAKDERIIINKHLTPEFGKERLRDMAHYKRIASGFARIAEKPEIGGVRVQNIYLVFTVIMRFAAKAGHILAEPPRLSWKDGELPAPLERRPEGWRDDAIFEIEEIAVLLACAEIEPQYRVMYAVYFLTGSRFAEIIDCRLRDYRRKRKPLASLTIKAGKVGRAKNVLYRTPPVHPDLAAWLDWWIDEGYEMTHMRKLEPHDLLFPSASGRRQATESRKQNVPPHQVKCSHGELYKRWQRYHLPAAKLRHRRLHDARRTLLSFVRSSLTGAAEQEVARAITHRVIADKVLDGYTTFQWDAICKAIMSVDWSFPKPPVLGSACNDDNVITLRKWGA